MNWNEERDKFCFHLNDYIENKRKQCKEMTVTVLPIHSTNLGGMERKNKTTTKEKENQIISDNFKVREKIEIALYQMNSVVLPNLNEIWLLLNEEAEEMELKLARKKELDIYIQIMNDILLMEELEIPPTLTRIEQLELYLSVIVLNPFTHFVNF